MTAAARAPRPRAARSVPRTVPDRYRSHAGTGIDAGEHVDLEEPPRTLPRLRSAGVPPALVTPLR